MEVLEAVAKAFTFREIAKGLFISALFYHFIHPTNPQLKRVSSWTAYVISFCGFFFIYLLGRSWLAVVTEYVPEPYLVGSPFHANGHRSRTNHP